MRMTISVWFDDERGHYRARFRSRSADLREKVPDDFWRELGYPEAPRREAPKFEKLALQWATLRRTELEDETSRRRAELEAAARRKMTIAQVFELYCVKNPKLVAEMTLERDRCSFQAVTRHIDPGMLPEDIDDPILVDYRNRRMHDTVLARRGEVVTNTKRPVRSRTIRNELDLLRRLIAFAMKWERVTGCEGVRFSQIPNVTEEETQQVALTEDEFADILAHASERNRRLLIFGVCTMLRRTPLLAFRGEWVDWRRGWYEVPAELMKKGRSKARRVFSGPLAQIALEQLCDVRSGVVWPNSKNGEAVKWIDDSLIRIADAAKVRRFSLHDLRSTGNTWLKNHGVEHLVRKRLLGHSMNTGDVTDLYTHIVDDELAKAVSIFDDIFARILPSTEGGTVLRMTDRRRKRGG